MNRGLDLTENLTNQTIHQITEPISVDLVKIDRCFTMPCSYEKNPTSQFQLPS